MNPTEESAQSSAPAVPTPRPAAPVMDVTPPRPSESLPSSTSPSAVSGETPVTPAPPREEPTSDPSPLDPATQSAPKAESNGGPSKAVSKEIKREQDAKTPPAKKPKPASQGSNSTTVAIIATVIIVLGLAILAVLAYKSSK